MGDIARNENLKFVALLYSGFVHLATVLSYRICKNQSFRRTGPAFRALATNPNTCASRNEPG